MPQKRNPLGLNPLQLRTLTLLQQLARLADYSQPSEEPDGVMLTRLPHPHGDHFHIGEAVVASRDATGLRNPAVWAALERKGLVRSTPPTAVVTPLGLDYDTGLRDTIVHSADHG
jgi:LmbE family N-acetylglucosaminyl deacetylase